MRVVNSHLEDGVAANRVREFLSEELVPRPSGIGDERQQRGGFPQLVAQLGVQGERSRFRRQTLGLRKVAAAPSDETVRDQRRRTFVRGRLLAFHRQDPLVQSHRRLIRPNADVLAERIA
jgi:hypothetical protein